MALVLLLLVAAVWASAAHQIPRTLHQIQAAGEPLDMRLMAAELRDAHTAAGWDVRAWKVAELRERYATDGVVAHLQKLPNWEAQHSGTMTRRLSVLLLREFGGVYVDRAKELVEGKTLDDVLSRLQPDVTFFTGACVRACLCVRVVCVCGE